LSAEVEALTKDLEKVHDELYRESQNVLTNSLQVSEKDTIIADLQKQVVLLINENKSIQSDLKQSQDEMRQEKENKLSSAVNGSDKDRIISEQSSEIEELRNENYHLNNENKTLLSNLETVQEELQREKDINFTTINSGDKDRIISEQSSEIEDLKSKNQELVNQIEVISHEVETLQHELYKVSQSSSSVVDQSDVMVEMRNQIEKLSEEKRYQDIAINDMQLEYSKLLADNEQKDSLINSLSSSMSMQNDSSSNDRDKQEVNTLLAETRLTLHKLESDVAEKEKYIGWLESELENHTKSDSDNTVVEILTEQVTQLQDKIKRHDEDISQKACTIQQLDADKATMRKKITDLERLCDELRYELQHCKHVLENNGKSASNSRDAEMKEMRDEIVSLRAHRDTKQMLLEKITGELKAAVLARASMEDKVQVLQSQLAFKIKLEDELALVNKELNEFKYKFQENIDIEKENIHNTFIDEITHLKSEIESAYVYVAQHQEKVDMEKKDMEEVISNYRIRSEELEEENVKLHNDLAERTLKDSAILESNKNRIELEINKEKNKKSILCQTDISSEEYSSEILNKLISNISDEKLACLVHNVIYSTKDDYPLLYINDIIYLLESNIATLHISEHVNEVRHKCK
jgi:chromosome segregation ATPase